MPTIARVPGGFQVRFATPGIAGIHFACGGDSIIEVGFPVWPWSYFYFRIRSSRAMRGMPPGSWRWICEISRFRPYADPLAGASQ